MHYNTDRPLLERTLRGNAARIPTGFGTSKGILIPGKKNITAAKARQAIEQSAVCAACRGGCRSHQADGVPVGMNFGKSSDEK
ncbi:MAG: hypothetical protein UR60_C0001G0017 [Candidatus Moranbacteria bacterium GW2011_GWF2_34_56]|nr:MAG: hypothetical protein UR51_C0002G0012 [Candidatus Moranbacteria bacterium GW2011_GWF1_34_10]KKP65410.1 MAG: hypothetical protein UR60_C0001G0017 [Candidatus Moranbacteria bacterium GW2011_GWF2_34_56]HBI16618.1 hypothetical protein [Candidatus Moranbacteria bacterium]